MSRVIPNKLVKTRAEIEGRSYRMVSFFHNHPSEIPEDQWTLLEHDGSKFIVDKLTLTTMSECECEFLTRSVDSVSSEAAIVSVKVSVLSSSSPDEVQGSLTNDIKEVSVEIKK
jgi:hypothetical protein|tara:strand:+ start:1496 stop:1837 length:342 start_codon:yes stop_codon:yes gene_type:complete